MTRGGSRDGAPKPSRRRGRPLSAPGEARSAREPWPNAGLRSSGQGSPAYSPGQLSLWASGTTERQPTGFLCAQARVAAGWSQTALAAALGLSQPSLSRAEMGTRLFSFDEVLTIGRLTQRDPRSLLGRDRGGYMRGAGPEGTQGMEMSRSLARAVTADLVSDFARRGGSLRALRRAKEGTAPMAASQAAIALELLADRSLPWATLGASLGRTQRWVGPTAVPIGVDSHRSGPLKRLGPHVDET